MDYFIGIDPGLYGAIAFLTPTGGRVYDCPVNKTKEGKAVFDLVGMADVLSVAKGNDTRCVIEHVHAMPKNGSIGCFKLGQGYGIWLGILAAFGIESFNISPQVWKRSMGVQGNDKEISRAMALRMAPELSDRLTRKKDHGRAEAILLALYAKKIP